MTSLRWKKMQLPIARQSSAALRRLQAEDRRLEQRWSGPFGASFEPSKLN